jgi:hypothetical protein
MGDAMNTNTQKSKGLVIKQPGQDRINFGALIRLQFEDERVLPHGCRKPTGRSRQRPVLFEMCLLLEEVLKKLSTGSHRVSPRE